MPFSITHAAFEGFRVMRRAPLAVVMWGVVYFACLALILAAVGTAVLSVIQGAEAIEQDPAAAGTLIGSVLTAYLVAIPLAMIAASIIVAATCRAVLTPKAQGFFYMRLGGAELRLLGAYLIIFVAGIVAFAAVAMVFAMVMGGAVVMSGGMGQDEMPPVALALIYPLYFGMIVLYVWVSVRLSLLGPVTVAEGRFALGRAWAATKGQFWTLLDLGAATVVRWFLVYFVSIILFVMLIAVGVGMIGADGVVAMETATPGDVMGRVLPFLIIGGVLMAAFAALQFTVLSTPFAVFYRDVIAEKPVNADPAP